MTRFSSGSKNMPLMVKSRRRRRTTSTANSRSLGFGVVVMGFVLGAWVRIPVLTVGGRVRIGILTHGRRLRFLDPEEEFVAAVGPPVPVVAIRQVVQRHAAL